MTGDNAVAETEHAALERLGELGMNSAPTTAVSYLYRAVNAVRNHLEQTALREPDLTWTAFVVLWVTWVWEEVETRRVAAEAGISKGTLTGVVKTLEARGLVERNPHPVDGRLVLLRLTAAGDRLVRRISPEFNAEVANVLGGLDEKQVGELTEMLHGILTRVRGTERPAPEPPSPGTS